MVFDDYKKIDEYITQERINWPQWHVKDGYLESAIFKKMKIKGIPYFMLLDKAGTLVKQGYSPDFDLFKDVQNLIE